MIQKTSPTESLAITKNFEKNDFPNSNNPIKNHPTGSKLPPELYARLKAEAKAPYRGLRQFIYVAFGASGSIGAFIFLAQLLAGRNIGSALPNFALQVGVVALMYGLFRLEQRGKRPKKP